MKAAVLRAFGSPLVVETVPDPVLGTGEVIVDVEIALVLAYANEVFSGARKYMLDLPVIPGAGAIGRVRALGPDATHLKIGDWVYCDPTVRSRDNAQSPDITLQGLSARGEGGMRLQKYFGNGAYAEQMRVPTENAIALGTSNREEAVALGGIGTMLVPYGGFLAADLKAGESVLISGATGAFGSAAVATALAMGAGWVIATGRNADSLKQLERRYGARVRSVRMTGDDDSDRGAMLAAAPGPIDCVMDILPPAATTTQVRAALMTVRPYGRVVLMGGVGMLGGDDLALPYPWIMRNCITIHGQWMYPPSAVPRMVALARNGLIDLTGFEVATFAVEDVNAAVEHAATHAGPFQRTRLKP